MLNVNKLEKISYLVFENALRLHYDSIHLFKDDRYPSAYFLSVLSQEKLGKMNIIDDFIWHTRVDGRMPKFEEEWLKLLHKHPQKQTAFIRHSPISNFSKKG
jgi:AbiV family abortive infection protein